MMKKLFLSFMMLAACAIGMSADELTVADGTNSSSNVPFYGSWVDSPGTTCQVMYHADSLVSIPEGAEITGIKFYLNSAGIKFSGATFQLSMGEVEEDAWPSIGAAPFTGLTVVSTDVPNPELDATEIEFVFDSPYVYQGGNLVFETLVLTKGTYSSTTFMGTNTSAASGYTSYYRGSIQRFIPKTTFVYDASEQPYKATISPKSLNFGKQSPDSETELTVTLSNKGTNAFTPAISGLEAPFSTTYQPAELASGSSVEIPVKFAPTAEGDYSGNLLIDCGQAGNFTVPMTGISTVAKDLTVCDGTLTSGDYPYKSSYTDQEGTLSQMIYNGGLLAEAKDKLITAIKFYATSNISDKGATLQVSVTESDIEAYEREGTSGAPDNLLTEDDLTVVSTTSLPNGVKEWEIVFDEPFEYKGGNLVIQTLVTVAGGYEYIYFNGVNTDATVSYNQYGSWSKTMSNFLPKMTVTYKDAATDPEVEPVDIMGEVLDQDHEYLEGVTVTLTEVTAGGEETYTTTTDEEGMYFFMEFEPVEGATYNLTFEKEGYVTETREDIDLEEVLTVIMTKEGPETVMLWGYVRDTADQPIAGVSATLTVAVENAQGAPMLAPANPATYTATTDADGIFVMEDIELVEGATYVVKLTKDGYLDYTSDDLALDDDSEFSFTMQPDTSVGIMGINADNVASVRYYNAKGQSSDKPFDGVNMVVIEHKNGTKTTIKMVK